MRYFIRHGMFDAVISFLEAPSFICEVAGLPSRNWKLVVGERSADPAISKSVKLKMYRWFHVLADYIIANSFSNLQLVRSINPLLPAKKCKVIYNTIDMLRWKPIPNFRYRRDFKLKLVVAARQTYKKNLIGLIDALSLLSEQERTKIKVDWYGDRVKESYVDGSISEVTKRIKINGLDDIISIHSATHDIERIIQESDAVGLFSFYEGFPNVVCEGMACGKPVICSAVSDIPSLLSYDMHLLFDPSEPKSIKESISYLINLNDSKLAQIGMKNKVIARKLFNKEVIINMYLQLLSP